MDQNKNTSNYKNIIFYVLVLLVFLTMIYLVLKNGKSLEVNRLIIGPKDTADSTLQHFLNTLHHNLTHPIAILLLQIITIIFTARTFGFLFNKIGQPTVVGEILAGIFLGPSVLGWFFPEFSVFMFPKESLGNLHILSQVGLILFMFVIGMELDLKVLKTRAKEAVIISHIGIIIPYALGIILAFYLYKDFGPDNFDFTSFGLFMGIAMSITAFPVLARILQERGLTKTKLGLLVITSAASDDITAWCILAAVIAIVKAGSFTSSLFTIAMALGYLIIMIKIVQPFFKKIGEVYSNRETLSLDIIASVFGILLISSFVTELIGIHALIGAFLAGVMMPPFVSFRRILIEKVESVSLGLLLPLFFVFTGLRTQIGLLSEGHLWMTCGLIIFVAILGKMGGATLAAKVVGQNWKNSLSIGALMNTRGLMELVVLNIGYDLGILKPEIFAMMVIMALVTTFMTGPVLDFINKIFEKVEEEEIQKVKKAFRILLSFANPQSGRKLARIANLISGNSKKSTEIVAMHVTPSVDINQYQIAEYEKESFRPVKSEANKLGLKIDTRYKVSADVRGEILEEANGGAYDLLLVGMGQSVLKGTVLGQFIRLTARTLKPGKLFGTITGKTAFKGTGMLDEKTSEFLNNSKVPVGIFIDNGLDDIHKILLPVFSVSDVFLIFYAKKIINNSNVNITILDMEGFVNANAEIRQEINTIENYAGDKIKFSQRKDWKPHTFKNYDLTIMSVERFESFAQGLELDKKESSSFLLLRS